ncbi:unnamed protein product [Gongylonema pulchrum]|uniref:SCP domain-containing protein n=1 Tax=Gongylonema pulchrum TaxID=637853 RepID=A0A183DBC6_9BILA|nr:unnamed protein product [Gongylonema pulchrum]
MMNIPLLPAQGTTNLRQFLCGRSPMKPRERKAVLDEHNRLRASLASGKEVNAHRRYMPKASNMRELVSSHRSLFYLPRIVQFGFGA